METLRHWITLRDPSALDQLQGKARLNAAYSISSMRHFIIIFLLLMCYMSSSFSCISSDDCNSSTDSINISVPLFVQTNFDSSMSSISSDVCGASSNFVSGGIMNEVVDGGLGLSCSSSEMIDLQSLLQPLPSSSLSSQTVRYFIFYITTLNSILNHNLLWKYILMVLLFVITGYD